MLKNILKLEGAQEITQKDQKKINGGIPPNCRWYSYMGNSLAECRSEYPNATFNAITCTCRALVCGGDMI
jgi:hypothetical protein